MKDTELINAEVTEVIYVSDKPDQVYGVKFRQLGGTAIVPSTDTTANDNIAIPLNFNNVRIPIKGEVILVIKASNALSAALRLNLTNYYIDIISLQHSINHNALPTSTSMTNQTQGNPNGAAAYEESSTGNMQVSENNPELDPDFTEKVNVAPLQPFVGDTIITGRYGSSLRFSSNSKGGNFTVQPKFKGDPGNPITILRNTAPKSTGDKKFIVEDFNNEDNVFVLASGQQLEFKQSSTVLKAANAKQINTWQTEKWGTTPQAFLSSGRIVFNSTQKEIIAFAKKGIALSSETNVTIDARQIISLNANKIELGDSATEPLLLGTQFQAWFTSFINALGSVIIVHPVVGPCTPLAASPSWPAIATIAAQIPTILSTSVFTTKKTTP